MIYFKIFFILFFITFLITGLSFDLMERDEKRFKLWYKVSKISWTAVTIMIIVGVITLILIL